MGIIFGGRGLGVHHRKTSDVSEYPSSAEVYVLNQTQHRL